MIAFTVAPRHLGRHVPTAVLGFWEELFPGDVPNASLVYRRANGSPVEIAYAMGRPTYSAKRGQLSFEVTLLSGSKFPLAKLRDVAIFIDPTSSDWVNLGLWCGAEVVLILGEAWSADITLILIEAALEAAGLPTPSSECLAAIEDVLNE